MNTPASANDKGTMIPPPNASREAGPFNSPGWNESATFSQTKKPEEEADLFGIEACSDAEGPTVPVEQPAPMRRRSTITEISYKLRHELTANDRVLLRTAAVVNENDNEDEDEDEDRDWVYEDDDIDGDWEELESHAKKSLSAANGTSQSVTLKSTSTSSFSTILAFTSGLVKATKAINDFTPMEIKVRAARRRFEQSRRQREIRDAKAAEESRHKTQN